MVELSQILDIIRRRGPVMPADIRKEVDIEILFASAMLSELRSKGQVEISSVKVGGSPLYYLKGQESMLESFSDRLGEKDKMTYESLKQEKVIRDSFAQPLTRVSLRQIKDFAKPLRVRVGEDEEIFWKWHTLPNEEAGTIIRRMLGQPEKDKPEPPKAPEPVQQEAPKSQPEPAPIPRPVQKKRPEPPTESPAPKKEEQKPLSGNVSLPDDPFSRRIRRYFEKNGIDILKATTNRKGSDMDFLIRVPSAAGSLRFACKAKSKKRISDGDLSSAYVQGQTEKLPMMFLATGELTKKAKAMLDKEFQGMAFQTI
ncbi:MAG: hypothetical protein ABIC95_00045 [archaeon]